MSLEFANLVKFTTATMAAIGLIALIVWVIRNANSNKVAEIILWVISIALLLGIVGLTVWAWCTW